MNTNKKLSHWSRYWQTGHLTSLPEDFTTVYDGEIETFWKNLAETLPADARVLDVCSGNGPVALLIARHAPDAKVWAADAAAIDPATALAGHPALEELSRRVTYLPETSSETVNTLNMKFDLVTSQYGLEYTNWPASAKAITSVLKPGATLAIVAHVPTSAMIETMEVEQKEYALLADTGILNALQELGQKGSGGARKSLKRSLIRLRPAAGQSVLLANVLHGSGALLNMEPLELASQQPAIRQYTSDLISGRDRAGDLLQTNQRIMDEPRWFEAFVDAGLELVSEQELLYQGRHRCGLALEFVKPAS